MSKVLPFSLAFFLLSCSLETGSSLNVTEINKTLVDVIKSMAPDYKQLTGKDLVAKVSLGDKTSAKGEEIKDLELNIDLGNLEEKWSTKYWDFKADILLKLEETDRIETNLNITAKTDALSFLHWTARLYKDRRCSHSDSNSELRKEGCHLAWALKRSSTIDKAQEAFEDSLDKMKKIIFQHITDAQTNEKDKIEYTKLLKFITQITIDTLETGGFAVTVQGDSDDTCVSLDYFLENYPILGSLCFLKKTKLTINENTITLSGNELQLFIEETKKYEDIKKLIVKFLMGLEIKHEESIHMATNIIYILLQILDDDLNQQQPAFFGW